MESGKTRKPAKNEGAPVKKAPRKTAPKAKSTQTRGKIEKAPNLPMLEPQEEKFALSYILHGNAGRAARDAGFPTPSS